MNLPDVSILCVEDDSISREILSSFITKKYPAIQVYSASSAGEGLDLFNKHHQSIIITDINFVDSDGIWMTRAIRMLDPNTAIIFITGSSDVEMIMEFMGSASCNYLCKPLHLNDLFTLLDNLLRTVDHKYNREVKSC